MAENVGHILDLVPTRSWQRQLDRSRQLVPGLAGTPTTCQLRKSNNPPSEESRLLS